MSYFPQPVDVSDIELDKALQEMVEKLAKNTHDIWAAQRFSDGWSFGAERNDTEKQNPCLVEYANLPEAEKEYDRKVSEGVIKTMLKMGYTFHGSEARELDVSATKLDELLKTLQGGNVDTAKLFSLWKDHHSTAWANQPELYRLLGEKTLRAGEALLAYDILSKGLELFNETVMLEDPSDPDRILFVRMQQQRALALAQSGAAEEASRILQRLCSQGADDGETRGIMGRTYKDLALAETDQDCRTAKFQQAFSIYHQAYLAALEKQDVDTAYYNGINAATLALFAGDLNGSDTLARRVLDLCQSKLKTLEKEQAEISHWLYATLGETELLIGDQEEALFWYRKAAEGASGDIRALASMRKQARNILREQQRDPALLDGCLPVSSVVVFTGHMIDSPGRKNERFPPALEEQVRQEIARELTEVDAGIGYSSAACGADILFLEEMLRRGGEINVVLPFEKDRFIAESVELVPGSTWLARFEDVLSKAVRVQVMGHYDASDNNTNFEFANLYLFGASLTRGLILDTEVHGLTVWDGKAGGGLGGTSSAVCHWQKQAHSVRQINPLQLMGTDIAVPSHTPKTPEQVELLPGNVQHHTYLPMLFADVKGYSKLTEAEVVRFSLHFLGRVGEIIRRHETGIMTARTQGDSLFLVFRDLDTAVRVAVTLRDETAGFDWSEYGLPAELLFRIALDAGPCYSYIDPVVGGTEFCGSYIVRAARMEPVTPPGQIYASETFVALAHATGLSDVCFDYAGQVALPKNYGVIPVFHLR